MSNVFSKVSRVFILFLLFSNQSYSQTSNFPQTSVTKECSSECLAFEKEVRNKVNLQVFVSFAQKLYTNFSQFDKNSDDKVCKYENIFKFKFTYSLRAILSKFDINADGCISKPELSVAMQQEMGMLKEKMIEKWIDLDTNKDFYLEYEEIKSSGQLVHYFRQIDKNNDKKLSIEEMVTFYNEQVEQLFSLN